MAFVKDRWWTACAEVGGGPEIHWTTNYEARTISETVFAHVFCAS